MSLIKYFEPKKTKIKRNLKDRVEESAEPIPKRQKIDDSKQTITPQRKSLQLPTKYSNLLISFNAVELAVSLMYNRKEDIYFDKIVKSVERLTKRSFNERIVGQIKAIYPSAYSFSRTNDRRIIVKPVAAITGKFTLSIITERRETFYNSLLELIFEHHKTFLSRLDKPIHVENHQLKRWHPKFRIESVEGVEPVELLDDMRPTITTELSDVSSPQPQIKELISSVDSLETKQLDRPENALMRGLKGLPAHLIAKVKENHNRKMVRVSDDNSLPRRLPTFLRIVRSIFTTERKTSLIRDSLVDKLMHSYDGLLAEDEIDALFTLAINQNSIKSFSTSGGAYISI